MSLRRRHHDERPADPTIGRRSDILVARFAGAADDHGHAHGARPRTGSRRACAAPSRPPSRRYRAWRSACATRRSISPCRTGRTIPTFDLDYHLRLHGLSGTADMDELLREIAPAYETPFDRSRPLWEARLFRRPRAWRPRGAVLQAPPRRGRRRRGQRDLCRHDRLRSATSRPRTRGRRSAARAHGSHEPPASTRLLDALRDRVDLDLERTGAAARAVVDTLRHPDRIRDAFTALRSIVERGPLRQPLAAQAGGGPGAATERPRAAVRRGTGGQARPRRHHDRRDPHRHGARHGRVAPRPAAAASRSC